MKIFFFRSLLTALFLACSLPAFSQGIDEEQPRLPKYVIHYVSEGDNLHILAAYYLNSPRSWKEIYEMNKSVITNPNSLEVGSRLTIAIPEGLPPQSGTLAEYKYTIGVTGVAKKAVMRKKTDTAKPLKSDTVEIPESDRCTDSDKGISINTLGITCAQGDCETDFCRPDHLSLVEHFCKNNQMQWKEVSCPDGCLDGSCMAKQEKSLSFSAPEPIADLPEEEVKTSTIEKGKKEKKERDELKNMIGNFNEKKQPKKEEAQSASWLNMVDDPDKLFDEFGMLLLIFLIVVLLVCFVSFWVIFTKAGVPGWHLFIPFFNLFQMTRISGLSGWLFILFFVPVINYILNFIWSIYLAKRFGKGLGFAFGLFFLPFIFFPILAFGKAEYS